MSYQGHSPCTSKQISLSFACVLLCLDLSLSNFATSICSSITWQQFCLLKRCCFSVDQTRSDISRFFSHLSLYSLCSYYLPNHYQSCLNLSSNRRFINRQAVITVCAFVAWLKVKCYDKSALRSFESLKMWSIYKKNRIESEVCVQFSQGK